MCRFSREINTRKRGTASIIAEDWLQRGLGRLRFEGTTAAGGTIPQHTHGEHVIIALADGTGELTDKDGKKQMLNLKKDTATVSAPTTHSAVNTGKGPLHLIVVDLK